MRVFVNGESMEFENGKNIDEILAILGVEQGAKSRIFAITLNANFVKKEDYKRIILKDGDKIEMLQFMGGG
ncbi:sulfur carrier protein ThiS [Helicobacter sp. 23-1045]